MGVGVSSEALWISIVRGLLWLAAWLVSVLLVYWLYIAPIYRPDWTSTGGSLVFAFLAVLSAVGFYNNVFEALTYGRDRDRMAVAPARTADARSAAHVRRPSAVPGFVPTSFGYSARDISP